MPRLWDGETVVCLGSGPSLTPADVDAVRGRARVIAVKDAYRLAPWADVLYGAGDVNRWWQRVGPTLTFGGLRYSLDAGASAWSAVLKFRKESGIDTDPSYLATGANSGYQAINLAVHLGAARVVLLGYDMQPSAQDRDHFFGNHHHGRRLPFTLFKLRFQTIVEPLKALGIGVLNASRETALDVFPRCALEEALA